MVVIIIDHSLTINNITMYLNYMTILIFPDIFYMVVKVVNMMFLRN